MKKAGAFTFELTREGIEARLGEMEKKLDRLKSLYESFFSGIERMPPNTLRREMNRLMLEMQQVPIANSSLRFRSQALSQKWVLLVTYWNRTLREIEAGTFRRDLARAQRHMSSRGGFITEEEALSLGIPKSRVKAFVARQQTNAARRSGDTTGDTAGDRPPPPTIALESTPAPIATPPVVPSQRETPRAAGATPPPLPSSARQAPPRMMPHAHASSPPPDTTPLAGLSEQSFADAYTRYRKAYEDLGIADQAKPLEKVRSQLSKVLPRILAERGCSKLRLEVQVEEGKVKLQAWPDREK